MNRSKRWFVHAKRKGADLAGPFFPSIKAIRGRVISSSQTDYNHGKR